MCVSLLPINTTQMGGLNTVQSLYRNIQIILDKIEQKNYLIIIFNHSNDGYPYLNGCFDVNCCRTSRPLTYIFCHWDVPKKCNLAFYVQFPNIHRHPKTFFVCKSFLKKKWSIQKHIGIWIMNQDLNIFLRNEYPNIWIFGLSPSWNLFMASNCCTTSFDYIHLPMASPFVSAFHHKNPGCDVFKESPLSGLVWFFWCGFLVLDFIDRQCAQNKHPLCRCVLARI